MLAGKGEDVNHKNARLRAQSLVDIACSKQDSREPVDNETWAELLEMGEWAKGHALKPSLIAEAIPSSESTRTWFKVKHAAIAILDSLTGT